MKLMHSAARWPSSNELTKKWYRSDPSHKLCPSIRRVQIRDCKPDPSCWRTASDPRADHSFPPRLSHKRGHKRMRKYWGEN